MTCVYHRIDRSGIPSNTAAASVVDGAKVDDAARISYSTGVVDGTTGVIVDGTTGVIVDGAVGPVIDGTTGVIVDGAGIVDGATRVVVDGAGVTDVGIAKADDGIDDIAGVVDGTAGVIVDGTTGVHIDQSEVVENSRVCYITEVPDRVARVVANDTG